LQGVCVRGRPNNEQKAQLAFTAARAEQEKRVQTQPDYGPALCLLGLIDAALVGRKRRCAKAGAQLSFFPWEKDPMNGMIMIEYLAVTAA